MSLITVQAQFVRGNPMFIEYTPSAAVAAGDIIVVGDLVLIAHSAVAADTLGNFAVGGGVYRIVALTGFDGAPGQAVSWDATNEGLIAADAAGTNKFFGFIGPNWNPTGAADEYVEAYHSPQRFIDT